MKLVSCTVQISRSWVETNFRACYWSKHPFRILEDWRIQKIRISSFWILLKTYQEFDQFDCLSIIVRTLLSILEHCWALCLYMFIKFRILSEFKNRISSWDPDSGFSNLDFWISHYVRLPKLFSMSMYLPKIKNVHFDQFGSK